MLTLIIGLTVAGVLLICAEIFVPGLIVGICGVLALLAAVVLSYMQYGSGVGDLMLSALLAGGIIFAFWWIAWIPRSALGRKWTLNTAIEGPTQHPDFSRLLGELGQTLTALRPGGVAKFDDQRVDVVAESGWIEAGEQVRVLRADGTNVVVQRVARTS
jgi:membrane-bound serine protease (ClpP class)